MRCLIRKLRALYAETPIKFVKSIKNKGIINQRQVMSVNVVYLIIIIVRGIVNDLSIDTQVALIV